MSVEHSDYRFDPASLAWPRPAGISALMRIRNGAEFLRATIESHVEHYDEIIACYNDCSDDTAQILDDLAARYPGRVRPIHYVPRVHPSYGAEHDRTPTDSVHSLANFYNFTLAQARFCMAVKLDDDHLAMPAELRRAVRRIRAEVAVGLKRLYTFSGVNLVRDEAGRLAIYDNEPFSGTGDIFYFPVCPQIHWVQAPRHEGQAFGGVRLPKRYLGLMYFHLKHLKSDLGFGNLEPAMRYRRQHEFLRAMRTISLEDFGGPQHVADLIRRHSAFDYRLRTHRWVRGACAAMADREPPLRIRRLERLADDAARIDWTRDLMEPLERFQRVTVADDAPVAWGSRVPAESPG